MGKVALRERWRAPDEAAKDDQVIPLMMHDRRTGDAVSWRGSIDALWDADKATLVQTFAILHAGEECLRWRFAAGGRVETIRWPYPEDGDA